MLLLTTTSDMIRVRTSNDAPIQVYAAWSDISGSTVTVGRTVTGFAGAAISGVAGSPASSTVRNVKTLIIQNTSTTQYCYVQVYHYNGTTDYEIEGRSLGPGEQIMFTEHGLVVGRPSWYESRPWHGDIMGAFGRGDPGELMLQCQRATTIAATPTNITTSIARCSLFCPPVNMTVNRLRAFGVGSTTDVYRVAVYRLHDRTRLMAETAFSTAADTWVSIGSTLNISLIKNTCYFVAVSVNATGTTAGCMCEGTTIAATTGRVNTTPMQLPGNLAQPGVLNGYHFQFAVTTGALPDPAGAPVAPAAWTGGMPAFWLDNSDT